MITVFYPAREGVLDLDYRIGPFIGALSPEEVKAVADGAKGSYARAFVDLHEDGGYDVWFTNDGEGEASVESREQAEDAGLLGHLTYEVVVETPERA